MVILFILNLIAAVLLLFVPLWFSVAKLKLDLINPVTIVLCVSLPVQLMKLVGGPLILIEDGLFDQGYQFALLMTNVQTIAQTLSLIFLFYLFSKIRVQGLLPFKNLVLSRRDLNRGEIFFLLVFCLALFFVANAEFGIINWILNPREGYQLYRTGNGQWYALAESALSVSFLLALLANPSPRSVMLSSIYYLALGYLLGSKGMLLSFFVTGLVFLWFLKWKHLNRVIVFGMPLLFMLLLFNLYLALADQFDLQAIFEYFDYYKNAADYYRGYLKGEINLFYGDVLLSSFWSYVPRGLVVDKPVVYGILHVNEIFYPGQAELTNTPAFGGAVEQFADFGVIGVVIFGLFSTQSIMNAFFFYLIFRKPGVNFQRVTLATVLLLLVQFVPTFGTYFPGGLYLILLISVILVMKGIRRRVRRRRLSVSQ